LSEILIDGKVHVVKLNEVFPKGDNYEKHGWNPDSSHDPEYAIIPNNKYSPSESKLASIKYILEIG